MAVDESSESPLNIFKVDPEVVDKVDEQVVDIGSSS